MENLTSDRSRHLDHDLPVIVPVGLVERMARTSRSCRQDTASISARLAEETGAILAPLLPLRFAAEMAGYPGTSA